MLLRRGNSFANTVVVVVCLLASPASHASTGTFIDKFHADELRVVSYNVNFDAIFTNPNDAVAKFDRIVNALDPDVLNLQEIYNYSANDVAALMDSVMPLSGETSWHAYDRHDNVIVSKYPILQTAPISSGGASALIDLPDTMFAKDLFVANDHWFCCSNESGRQAEADRTIRDLKDFREGNGAFLVPQNTPMLLLGDLNIVRSGRPLVTAITGDIVDNLTYGPDSPPDWDGTSFTDSNPLHNGTGPSDWTWRDDALVFDPGILDFILYTDSVMATANKFVLNTATMTSTELTATGLKENDVILDPEVGTYDHLPLVTDFRMVGAALPGDYNGDGFVDSADFTVWRDGLGEQGPRLAADGNENGEIDAGDYLVWKDNFGRHSSESTSVSVPEPRSSLLLLGAMVWIGLRRRATHGTSQA